MIVTTIKNKIKTMIKESKGCVLCGMVSDYEFNLLSNIQYQVTNDDRIREQISIEGGFCDFHFKQFKQIASGKTKLLLDYSLIKNILSNGQLPNINCRICSRVDEFESSAIPVVIELFMDESFRMDYAQSFGLCIPHLRRILEENNDERLADWLKQTYKNQMTKLKSILEEMMKANSYYSIGVEKRRLINLTIEKFTGRKSN